MANKYLEKIAVLDAVMGYTAADKGDKVGGTLSGIVAGLPAAIAGARLAGVPGAVAGSVAGGYLGGKAYSKIKDHFRSPSDLKKHLQERNKR